MAYLHRVRQNTGLRVGKSRFLVLALLLCPFPSGISVRHQQHDLLKSDLLECKIVVVGYQPEGVCLSTPIGKAKKIDLEIVEAESIHPASEVELLPCASPLATT